MAEFKSNTHLSESTDLTGLRFGHWTVAAFAETRKSRRYWNCVCDCGTLAIVCGRELRRGGSKGCIRCRNRTHGERARPEYVVWKKMRSRCQHPTNKDYRHYGGRGIGICDEWQSFSVFLQDMGSRPSSKHTIERIDNSQGYSRQNCRWATRVEQSRNTRRNHLLTFSGITQSIPDWADQIGIPAKALGQRIRAGWSIERALTTRLRTRT
jgi:hypothetical protein